MAESTKTPAKAAKKAKAALIDSIYIKYTKSVIRALASSDFYEYFMSAIAVAENEFQFSNRKMEKLIDESWIEAVEEALPGLQNIINHPRNVIREDELIVNVAHARKCDAPVVRHLAQHGSTMIDDFAPDEGEVQPNKLMQKLREDSQVIYENRLTITVLENAYHFVKIRYDALANAMTDEFGAKLKMTSNMDSATEHVHMDMFLHIKERDDVLSADDKHRAMFDRIARLNRVLSGFMNTPFAQSLMKANRVKGAIVKTNVLKKNADYKAIVKLYEFLQQYGDVGYAIKVTEQSPEISETFQQDMFHSVLFNYIILKNHLEDESDRELPTPATEKKRTLKPKFIKQIIEELTEDYDLPDVEVRRVLIEELTKEQLMAEEEAERRRLVEEQEQRKKEEEEKLRLEKEAEEEKLRIEKEKEEERIRKEKEAEEARLAAERLERDMEDRRRGKLFRAELNKFFAGLEKQKALREAEAEKARKIEERQDFEDAAKLLEEQEQRKKDEADRIRRRQEEIRERIRRERILAAERRKENEIARTAEEEARIEAERREKEAQQLQKDREQLKPYLDEVGTFFAALEARVSRRKNFLAEEAAQSAQAAEERRLRRERKDVTAQTKPNSGGDG